jgi:hypothetical protein
MVITKRKQLIQDNADKYAQSRNRWISKNKYFYIDIENILISNIPVPPEYGLERDDNGEVINPLNLTEVVSESSSSLIPSIGIVFDF